MAQKFFIKIENTKDWQGLLQKVLFQTFFHNIEWEEFLEQNFKWLKFERYLYRNSALLSLARMGEKLISHPFCEYGGPLPLVEKIDYQQFKLDLFSEFKNPIRITFHPHLLNYFQNESRTVLDSFGRVSYFVEGSLDLRKTTRHEIEKAQKQSLKIEEWQSKKELEEFYSLYLRASRRHRVPAYPFAFFEYFFTSSQAEIALAKYQDKVIAGSIFLFYEGFCHYFLNASDDKFRDLGANYLILWNQVQDKNYQIFDLGGTRKNSSLQTFKEGWGGKEYPIFELTNRPQENRFRSSKLRNLFGFLPLFLIKKISPYLLKYKI